MTTLFIHLPPLVPCPGHDILPISRPFCKRPFGMWQDPVITYWKGILRFREGSLASEPLRVCCGCFSNFSMPFHGFESVQCECRSTLDGDFFLVFTLLAAQRKDHIHVRILQRPIDHGFRNTPCFWALEPECRILMCMWSLDPKTLLLKHCPATPHAGQL